MVSRAGMNGRDSSVRCLPTVSRYSVGASPTADSADADTNAALETGNNVLRTFIHDICRDLGSGGENEEQHGVQVRKLCRQKQCRRKSTYIKQSK